MQWYADNSELTGLRGASIPDMLLFGGIAVPADQEAELRNAIESVKERYSHKRAPIKWNLKDLKALYIKQGMESLYEELLSSSKEWRMDIARVARSFDFNVIVSVIESHSVEKSIIKQRKPDLARYAFTNGLMRYALHVQETAPDRANIVLDWPDRGDSNPFDSEYASAYNDGRTREGHVGYNSGPLDKLKFLDCVSYVNMRHSTLLQFADLVVGATRELIECSIDKKSSGLGVDFAKEISRNYRGYPDQIIGRGISLASSSSGFKSSVYEFVNRELSN
ncbi:MAG: DUF3800 domain-containing protein [Pseudomonadota bacterium]